MKHQKHAQIVLLIVATIFWGANLHAQKIQYTYDLSGNRISREKVIDMSQTASSASKLKSSTEESGKMGEAGETGIPKFEEVLSELTITIYPNPTQGKLRVDITGEEIPKDARIYVYNVQGTMIRQLTSVSASNELDISAQPAGTYVMRIVLHKNSISTWAIIKN